MWGLSESTPVMTDLPSIDRKNATPTPAPAHDDPSLQLMWAFQRGAKMMFEDTKESALGLLDRNESEEKRYVREHYTHHIPHCESKHTSCACRENLDLVLECVAFDTNGERFHTKLLVSSSFLVLVVRKIILLKLFGKTKLCQFSDQLYKPAPGAYIARCTNLGRYPQQLRVLMDNKSLVWYTLTHPNGMPPHHCGLCRRSLESSPETQFI